LLLLLLRCPGKLTRHLTAILIRTRFEEGVDPDNRQFTTVLFVLVKHRLILNLRSLVLRLHRPQHATALVDTLKLGKDSLFDKVGQLLNDKRALLRVLVPGKPELPVDDHLDRHGPAHRLLGRGRHRLVVGVRMERVAVVIDSHQRLQGGADIVEIHLLGVQRAARGLDMIFELLASFVGTVLVAHGDRPQPTCDAPDHRIFGVKTVAEEEGEVRCEIVDVHASRQVILNVGESVGEGERQLADGVRPGLCNVVAAD